MAKRLRKFPLEEQAEIQQTHAEYTAVNPAAENNVNELFYNKKGEAREHNDIVRQLKLYQIATNSKVEQILQNPKWQEATPMNEQEFRKSPRDIYKLTRELLVHPDDRRDMEEGQEIVDPRMLTDTLLKNLELSEYIPEKGRRQEAKLARKTEAVSKIQEAIESLAPLKLPGEGLPKYFRLMRITQGESKGYVLGTQNIGGKKVLFKSHLQGVIRRIEHAENRYSVELEKLEWIDRTLQSIGSNLGNWNEIKDSEEEIEILKWGLSDCIDSLKFTTNGKKKELLKKIEEALPLKDSTGRGNPSAIMAKLEGSKKYITARIGQIGRISEQLENDKGRVEAFAADQERPLLNFLKTVEELHEKFRILNGAELNSKERQRITKNLEDIALDAQTIEFEPESSMADEFIEQIAGVIEAIKLDNKGEAAEKFVKAYIVTKILRTRKKIYGIYREISVNPKESNPETLLEELDDLHEELKERKIAGEIETPEFYANFKAIYHLLNSLKKRLRELIYGEDMVSKAGRNYKKIKLINRAKRKAPTVLSIMEELEQEMGIQFAEKMYTPEDKKNTFERMKKRINETKFL